MSKTNIKSLLAFIFCSLFLFCSPFLRKQWDKPGNQAVICWDNYGYYLYLPSLFYDDLGKLNNYDSIQGTYHPASDSKDQATLLPSGYYVMTYPCGQAIMYFPAFAIGHCWAKAAGYRTDGFTYPYQLSITFWSILVSCIGLWMMRKLLLRYYEDWIVGLTLSVICVATNYYFYVSFSVLTHSYLFTLYAFILYLVDSFYNRGFRGNGTVFIIGFLSGLATITRPTEIICVFIPLLWGLKDYIALKERISFFFQNKKYVIFYLTGTLIAAAPLLIYWHTYTGHWLFYSYQGDDKTFSFLHPHLANVLFSYKKGWLTYTPVMILSILGFYQLYKTYRSLFWCIAVFMLMNIYLVSSWDIWWYGGSFSMRALIQSYSLLMFPLAAFLSDTFRRKYWQLAVGGFLCFCTWLNFIMSYQALNGILDGDNMSKAYYWRVFGKVQIKLNDKKFIDTDEEMPQRLVPSLKEMYHFDSRRDCMVGDDSCMIFSGRKVFFLNEKRQNIPKISLLARDKTQGWIRAYVDIYHSFRDWDVWKNAIFYIKLYEGNKVIKEKAIRIQRITAENKWEQIYVDL